MHIHHCSVRQKQTNLICDKEHHTGLCHDTYMTNVEGKSVPKFGTKP